MTARGDRDALAGVRVGVPAGLKLAAPYNHDPALLDALEPVAAHLAGLYLPVHPAAAASARPFRGPASPAIYEDELRAVARRCAPLGLGLSLLANAPSGAVDAAAVVRTAAALREENPRLRVTVADLDAARRVRALLPEVAIGVSTLAEVRTVAQLRRWRDAVGAVHVTVSREVNRRPDRLAELGRVGLVLGVVSYDDCVPACRFRAHHFRRDPASGRWLTSARCLAAPDRRARPYTLARKEILPGHLVHLEGLVQEVKVTGRDQETPEVLRRVRLYLEARSLEHPSELYVEPPEAWRTIAECDRRCSRCRWCADHIRRRGPALAGPDDGRRTAAAQAASLDLVGPGGARVTLTLRPLGPGPAPPRVVAGCGLYYRTEGAVDERTAAALVGCLADRLDRAAGGVATLAAAAAAGPLPGGYRAA